MCAKQILTQKRFSAAEKNFKELQLSNHFRGVYTKATRLLYIFNFPFFSSKIICLMCYTLIYSNIIYCNLSMKEERF